MSKIISVSGQKGGCGKSTVTIILASMLAYKYGKKVLVIDADTNQHSIAKKRQLDITTITLAPTGEQDENGKNKMAPKNWEIYDAVVALKKKGIDPYMIAEANLDHKEIIPILEKEENNYDYILLDLPGNVDSESYFKVIRYADVIFVPFIVDDVDFDSNFPFAKLLHDKFLNTNISNIKEMYYFWNKFDSDTRKGMFNEMQGILTSEMPNAKVLDNKMNDSSAVKNVKCRNTLCAPIGKFEEWGNIGVTVNEMCQKVL